MCVAGWRIVMSIMVFVFNYFFLEGHKKLVKRGKPTVKRVVNKPLPLCSWIRRFLTLFDKFFLAIFSYDFACGFSLSINLSFSSGVKLQRRNKQLCVNSPRVWSPASSRKYKIVCLSSGLDLRKRCNNLYWLTLCLVVLMAAPFWKHK